MGEPSKSIKSPVKPGDVLAEKYRVERVLGVGGMGVVVAATHIELEQRVALKFLLPEAAGSAELEERFVREGKAVAKLRSEHVTKILDVGRLETGAPYMVMELLEGRDLGTVLREARPLRVEEAAGFVLQACEAVAEAHAAGIVHRDLKPANLFLTRRVDGSGLVKVLDFGISKSLDPAVAGGLSLTHTSAVLGSPMYMSPEQLRNARNVDARCDIWALGVIVYELLARRTPFLADTLTELCFKVAQETPPRLKELRPEVPDELDAVVMRCLEKDPDKRIGSVAELARAIAPFAPASERALADRISNIGPARSTTATDSQPGTNTAPSRTSAEDSAWGSTRAQNPTRMRYALLAAGAGAIGIAVLASVMLMQNAPTVRPAAPPVTADLTPPVTPMIDPVVTAAPPPTTTASATAQPVASIARPAIAKTAPAASAAPSASSSSKPSLGFIPTRE
jgi:serine/threonine-protein kinase